jgi:Cd2+/Zn2+-exporting ATPase
MTKTKIPWKRIFSSIFAFYILIILVFGKFESPLMLFFFSIGAIFGGYYFSKEALEAIFGKHKITTDVLMLLAYLSAGFLEQYSEAMMLIFLYSITETLESITVQRTRTMIHSLISIVPKQTIRLKNDQEELVLIENLQLGDVIKIRAGEIVPIDGIIIDGQCHVDESSITGESIPIAKVYLSKVLAGSIVTDSMIKVKVEKQLKDSTVNKLIELVEEAQKHKHPLQLSVNKFTKIYNPLIVLFSLFIFIYGVVFNDIQFYGTMSASFLVAGAPCALAIGTPVTVIAAIGSAGKTGILAKGGSALERLAEVDGFAFDKTGTLTFGNVDVITVHSFFEPVEDILSIIMGLEQFSNDPFSNAIMRYCWEKKTISKDPTNVRVLPGSGIEGTIDDTIYFIGNLSKKNDMELSSVNEIEKFYENQAVIFSYLLKNEQILAIVVFKDLVRDDAKFTIQELQKQGFETYMLTGDKKWAANEIGISLGIFSENIYSELSPKDKMEIIKDLKKKRKLVMIGDGINDTPALASADLGIAMGVKGTDAAIETADISFMSDDISVLLKGIRIAKKMKKVLKQNILLSTLIIVAVLIGVILGKISLTLAILAHEGSEVLIVGNSFRLLAKIK